MDLSCGKVAGFLLLQGTEHAASSKQAITIFSYVSPIPGPKY